MVINSSNTRSPSPMSMRQNLNHNPNSRINQERELLGVRKSFTFAKSSISGQSRSLISNTPDNSPAEFVRRHSFGREVGNSLQDREKENERDPNSKPVARIRSPSVPKMTKNFMSPTISAVSKINPSPKKKVLGEKNEAIRTSASLSEGKFRSYTTSSLDFSDENGTKEDMVVPPCSHMNKLDEFFDKEPVKKVTDFNPGVENFELEHDLVTLCPKVPMNDAKSSDIIPRKCDMPKVVSDDNVILSACSLPTTAIAPLDADPFLPPYDPATNFLSPRPQFLHYKTNPRIESYVNQGVRLEDDFSSESFSETEISEQVQSEETFTSSSPSVGSSIEENSSFSESSSPKSQQLEEIVEHKIDSSPWFGGILKAVCLIFFTLLGFTAVYQGNLAKENINGLLSHMGLNAIEVKFSPLPFDNLTAWQEKEAEDHLVGDFVTRLEESESRPSISDEELLKCLNEYEEYDELIEEFERQKLEENYVVEDSVIENEEFVVEMIEEATPFEEVENQEYEYSIISEVQDKFQYDLKVKDQSISSLSQASEEPYDPIIEVQGKFQLDSKDDDTSLSPEVQPQVMDAHDTVTEVSESLALEAIDERNPPIHDTNEGSLASNIAAVSLFLVSLLTAIAFMFVKSSKTSRYFPAATKNNPRVQKKQTCWGDPFEVDMVEELSSFQKGNNEAQSMEKNTIKRNYKRESLASSSSEYTMSSFYGSFTTYSILHSKQRDDEVVTPVRRSSRIRSKITSP